MGARGVVSLTHTSEALGCIGSALRRARDLRSKTGAWANTFHGQKAIRAADTIWLRFGVIRVGIVPFPVLAN